MNQFTTNNKNRRPLKTTILKDTQSPPQMNNNKKTSSKEIINLERDSSLTKQERVNQKGTNKKANELTKLTIVKQERSNVNSFFNKSFFHGVY
jgi:hypothetical protein